MILQQCAPCGRLNKNFASAMPTGNNVHVKCKVHQHTEQHNMHVIMLMYMHVSCNMQEFQTFSMNITCMLLA